MEALISESASNKNYIKDLNRTMRAEKYSNGKFLVEES